MKRVVDRLCKLKKTIATMESCTGGGVANEITNIPGASEVIRFSAVTYSNEYKIKMGVPASTIDQYSVYSMETAIDMSHAISKFADSDYGIGVTGKFCKKDPANPEEEMTWYTLIFTTAKIKKITALKFILRLRQEEKTKLK